MKKIKINTPIEVNQTQYNISKKHLAGFIAHRKDEDGKLWIKPLTLRGGVRDALETILTNNN